MSEREKARASERETERSACGIGDGGILNDDEQVAPAAEAANQHLLCRVCVFVCVRLCVCMDGYYVCMYNDGGSVIKASSSRHHHVCMTAAA